MVEQGSVDEDVEHVRCCRQKHRARRVAGKQRGALDGRRRISARHDEAAKHVDHWPEPANSSLVLKLPLQAPPVEFRAEPESLSSLVHTGVNRDRRPEARSPEFDRAYRVPLPSEQCQGVLNAMPMERPQGAGSRGPIGQQPRPSPTGYRASARRRFELLMAGQFTGAETLQAVIDLAVDEFLQRMGEEAGFTEALTAAETSRRRRAGIRTARPDPES